MYSQGWLLIGSLLTVVGLFTRQPVASLLGLAIFLSAGASYLWDRYCLTRVEYRRSFTPRRAFYGETVTLTMEVTNRKALPLAWLEVVDELPEELVPLSGRVIPSVRQRRRHLVNMFSLRWYERVRRRFILRCDARGYFPLGPARIRSGDIFGFTVRGRDLERVDYLLVYPRVVPLSSLGLPALYPIGDVRRPRHLLEDATRVAGARAYVPGDPLRRIHWKATAKSGELRAKQYETTTSHRLAIFLNLDTLGRWAEYRGFVRPLLELLMVTAASVASWAVESGHLIGMYANGYLPQGLRWVRIPPATGTHTLALILESLAKLFATPVMPLGDLLQLEARTLPLGTTAVVVTAVVDRALTAGIERFRQAGGGVVVVMVGDEQDDVDLPVPVYRVPSVRAWEAMDGIELQPAVGPERSRRAGSA
ncbi:MAG: DUF58 domain-containing protein [bacterium]